MTTRDGVLEDAAAVDGAKTAIPGYETLSREIVLGRVAALYLADRVVAAKEEEGAGGTARFIVDCLTRDQTAAIARGILADGALKELFEIKLPRHFMKDAELPTDLLTDERATYYRNCECARPALLIANTGDDEQQSLSDLTAVGAPDLQSQPEYWVKVAGAGLPISATERRWWVRALAGLQEQRFVNLDLFAEYVVRVRHQIAVEGRTLPKALGAALPTLRLSADNGYFEAIPEKVRTHTSKWKAAYATAYSKRACYLIKQTPTGVVLSREDLQQSYDKVKEDLSEALRPVVESFIATEPGWTNASQALAEHQWMDVKPLFEGLRAVKANLGELTIAFYKGEDPTLLTDPERDHLVQLVARRATSTDLDVDKKFFDDHRDEMRDDKKLLAAWEQFIFGKAREHRDFFAGIASCLESFSWDTVADTRKLKIQADRRFSRGLRQLNPNAGMYFATRYAGARSLFGPNVEWDVGDLFRYPSLYAEWRTADDLPKVSDSKTAFQLKFLLELTVSNEGTTEKRQRQFVWRFEPQWIACELPGDWRRLVDHPLVSCRVTTEPVSAKGIPQSVDLQNVRTLVAAYSQARGSCVRAYQAEYDIQRNWSRRIEEAVANNWLPESASAPLEKAFETFAAAYNLAIGSFLTEGVAATAIEAQAERYGELLDLLCREAKGDRARQLLLRPLLELGTVSVAGKHLAAIVAPWQPLRFVAMARKARRIGKLVQRLLNSRVVYFGDPALFFRDLLTELEHPFYPEVVLGWIRDEAHILSLADTAADYTLHESPLAEDDGLDDTNESPAEGAARVVEIVQRYLALQPHEQASLSVVLYNSDSSRLPMAVVERLGALNENEEDVRCQVVLRHRDARRLRVIYQQIVEASGAGDDSFIASETTRDFMARLRIGIMAEQGPPPDARDGAAEDIVFSQDVIARHARLRLYLTGARPAANDLNPSQWSRRRPVGTGDMKSVVYLACPVQSKEGWEFLTAVASFLSGDWDGNVAVRWLPARELDFKDPLTQKIVDETHDLGAWVVNYDELLDRRQLSDQRVRVIRYKQAATQGRNLVISSRAPLGLLRTLVLGRLRSLELDLGDETLDALAERFISEANELSGDIVLRAAKRGRSASELMGLVLSHFLLRHELGLDQYAGWYFLDDYAEWLGQKEEQIADLMALAPITETDGTRRLVVIVVEAKYIDAASLGDKRKESEKQLRDTLRRIEGAVLRPSGGADAENGSGGSPIAPKAAAAARLDRDAWLARLSDLLVDGVRFPAGASLDLPEWRRAIRDGSCVIELRGYSQVFVSGPPGSSDASGSSVVSVPTAETEIEAFQEVFGRTRVREIVRAYNAGVDPTDIRRLSNGTGWTHPDSRRPSRNPATPGGGSGEKDDESTSDGGSNTTVSAPEQADTSSAAAVALNPAALPNPSVSADVQLQPLGAPNVGVWPHAEVAAWLAVGGPSPADSPEDLAWLEKVALTTRGALLSFRLQAKLLQSALTPNAALLKFQGSADLTVDQVMKKRSEFLTTHGLSIIAVQPEPGAVTLSVERKQRAAVALRDLWQRWEQSNQFSGGNSDLLIGVREKDGGLLVLSPGSRHAPHTLIAGTTGSGKSVLMQNILLSIAATNRPDEARIILIDPKLGVDYFAFEGLPHLTHGIIDTQDVALHQIDALVTEMDARYHLLRQARVANLREFNAKVSSTERMPTLWLIHDEFAEWMLVDQYKLQVTSAVARLGVKARAAGIHLVFAAQRPDANVMPLQLRANLGNRLILRVDSEGTSEIALGESGAENLLGKGHLLARLEGDLGLVYAQVPFATTNEIEELVAAIVASAAAR